MVKILGNKNLATRFQILIEVADKGPNVQQQDIAMKLEVTPQAISDYIRQLSDDGLLVSDGRSRYRVTAEGVNWTIKILRELRDYNAFVEKAITSISVCAAVAEGDLVKSQKVGLKMKDGLLFATEQAGDGATGIAATDARKWEDVGVTDVEGIVKLETGKATILKVHSIQKGGSRKFDIDRLRSEIKGRLFIGAIGIEALVVLKQLDAAFCMYGVTEAAIEAAHSGLDPLILSVEDAIPDLIKRLEEERIDYDLIDTQKG